MSAVLTHSSLFSSSSSAGRSSMLRLILTSSELAELGLDQSIDNSPPQSRLISSFNFSLLSVFFFCNFFIFWFLTVLFCILFSRSSSRSPSLYFHLCFFIYLVVELLCELYVSFCLEKETGFFSIFLSSSSSSSPLMSVTNGINNYENNEEEDEFILTNTCAWNIFCVVVSFMRRTAVYCDALYLVYAYKVSFVFFVISLSIFCLSIGTMGFILQLRTLLSLCIREDKFLLDNPETFCTFYAMKLVFNYLFNVPNLLFKFFFENKKASNCSRHESVHSMGFTKKVIQFFTGKRGIIGGGRIFRRNNMGDLIINDCGGAQGEVGGTRSNRVIIRDWNNNNNHLRDFSCLSKKELENFNTYENGFLDEFRERERSFYYLGEGYGDGRIVREDSIAFCIYKTLGKFFRKLLFLQNFSSNAEVNSIADRSGIMNQNQYSGRMQTHNSIETFNTCAKNANIMLKNQSASFQRCNNSKCISYKNNNGDDSANELEENHNNYFTSLAFEHGDKIKSKEIKSNFNANNQDCSSNKGASNFQQANVPYRINTVGLDCVAKASAHAAPRVESSVSFHPCTEMESKNAPTSYNSTCSECQKDVSLWNTADTGIGNSSGRNVSTSRSTSCSTASKTKALQLANFAQMLDLLYIQNIIKQKYLSADLIESHEFSTSLVALSRCFSQDIIQAIFKVYFLVTLDFNLFILFSLIISFLQSFLTCIIQTLDDAIWDDWLAEANS